MTPDERAAVLAGFRADWAEYERANRRALNDYRMVQWRRK